MKSLVVLSGKGGVGKSSIISSLAVVLSYDKKIICADCDVDASNLSLLFGLSESDYSSWSPLSTNQVAVIDKQTCISCGKCVDICYFDALKLDNDFPVVGKFSCEGCGACEIVCPVSAIHLQDINNANIGFAKTEFGFNVVSAQLLPGNSGSGKVVSQVKSKAVNLCSDADILLIDSAAGVGCPVISSVNGADFAILVTEPSPSGFSDLKKALDILNHFNIRAGLIINKFDLNSEYDDKISSFAKDNDISILKKIPFDKKFVDSMTEMCPLVKFDPSYESLFLDIKESILSKLYD